MDNAWGLAAGLALPPLAAAALVSALLGAHEHTQAAGATFVQCWNSGLRLRADARANGGRFPPPGADVERLIESQRQAPARACVRVLRYEWLDETGTRVRVQSLGADGAAGGEGCDEDLVVWVDAQGVYVSRDARELPREWR